MAEKRMFTQKIVDSDAFLEMPLSAQALYFHLNMRADDDGFVNNPRRITKLINASDDDLKILLVKRFIIGFESGVIVIKHWRMHNTIKSDRYHPTDYQEEFAQLGLKANKAYTDDPAKLLPPSEPERNQSGTGLEPEWIQNGSKMEPENRLGLGLDKGSDKKEHKSECTAPQSDAVLTIILNDKTEYPIMQADIDLWQETFPAVDVLAELKRMKVWCIDNPAKRKTKRGVRAFISRWLGNEQDRGGRQKGAHNGNSAGAAGQAQRNWGIPPSPTE